MDRNKERETASEKITNCLLLAACCLLLAACCLLLAACCLLLAACCSQYKFDHVLAKINALRLLANARKDHSIPLSVIAGSHITFTLFKSS